MVANPLDFYSDGRSKGKMKNHHFVDDLLEDQEFKQVKNFLSSFSLY